MKNWIIDQNRGRKIHEPLLLIDDEADNASINTHKDPKRSTTINRLIREIIGNFTRSTFIGYTATPFANIFIEPDSTQDMKEEDLFPRNFITALDPPNNYSGAERVFSETGDLRKSMVKYVDDYVDILPLKHRKNDPLMELPPSLYRAVRVFLLAKALRYIRGQGNKHCSMMINVSRFNDMQAKVEGLVYQYLEKLKTTIAVSARARDGGLDPDLQDLRADFDMEFSDVNTAFDDVLKILHKSSATIIVSTVNMRGGRLDYDKHKKHGLHVIAIGGLALARGLTLEGLTVTYLLRNVGASDTLMQMARWFGYRQGYEDLCRIFLPEASADHYRHISIAIEELRGEVNRMEQSGMTPYQFGLKVRQSPTGIRITAANKMRSASEMKLAQDYSGQHTEAHAIFNNKQINDQHRKLTTDFFQDIGSHSLEATEKFKYPYWTEVSGYKVTSLIEAFHFPEISVPFARISGTRSLLLDYISDRISGEFKHWDVVVAGPKIRSAFSPDVDLVPGLQLRSRRRAKGKVDATVFRITGTANKVADPGDAKIGLTSDEILKAEERGERLGLRGEAKYCEVRERPLLIIHLFGAEEGIYSNFDLGAYCLSLSVCLPTSETRAVERTYQVNAVFRRSLVKPLDDETDDDEDLLMEE